MDAFKEYGEKGLKLNIFYLNKIKTLLERKNIELKIIIYPWPGTIYYYDQKTPYEKNCRKIGQNRTMFEFTIW